MAEPAAAPAPVAAEPAAPAPEAKPETVKEQWDRLEAAGAASEPAEGSEAAKTEAEEPKPKANGKKKTVEPPPAPPNELQELTQNATRLGFVVEDGRVTTAERAAFRARQREAAEQRATLERELTSSFEGRLNEYKPKIERADALDAAIERGDHDAVAKILKFENWDKLVEDQIARKADPNYQRLRALEDSHRERQAQDEQRAKAEQQRQQQLAEQQARETFIQNLSTQMKSSSDKLIAAFHDEPGFVQAIFAVQRANYQATGELMTPEQAATIKLPGAKLTPREWIKMLHDRAAPVLAAPPPPAVEAAPVVKPAPRTPTVPKPKAAPTGEIQDKKAWFKNSERRLREAFAADEKLQEKRN